MGWSQGAPYTASYSYDALNRLTSSPLGTYTYGDPAHLHAVTAVGSGYTASYDATGNMTCRAPASSATCAGGTPTGAGLGYNNEGQLIGWQNTQQGTPSTATHAAYDGEGHRVASNVVSNGVTTSTTDYLAGGLEEVTTAGSTTTLTKYESVPGVCNVVIVGSGPSESISYVATDGLGSVSEALDGSGNVTAQQLYGPYGTGRYSLGAMPTSKGYTGQYGDPATTGLDYYRARYYDPLMGQFTSADTAGDGLNRYAYVRDDPETATDPTGHRCTADGGVCPGAGGGGGNSGKSPGCGLGCNSGGCQSENCPGGGGSPVTVVTPHSVRVGQPTLLHAGDPWNGIPVTYQWCTANYTCVDADMYSGEALKNLVAEEASYMRGLKDNYNFLKHWDAVLAWGGGAVVAIVVGIIAGFLAKNPWVGVSVGSTAGGWTAATLQAIFQVVENIMESAITYYTKARDDLQKAYNAGGSVWYVSSEYEGVKGSSTGDDDFIVTSSSEPTAPVIQRVGTIFLNMCKDGVGLIPSPMC